MFNQLVNTCKPKKGYYIGLGISVILNLVFIPLFLYAISKPVTVEKFQTKIKKQILNFSIIRK
mgnify:CR=1 FL=1